MTDRRRSMRGCRPAGSAGRDPIRVDDGGARPIEPPVRRRMEARLGNDFSNVRVHTDAAAAAAAERERAHAFTVAEDIVFGATRYAPATSAGEALLEHELGHVEEQRASGDVAVQRQPVDEPLRARGVERESPRLRLDPDIGRLSLGLSTLDGFDFNGSALKPAHLSKIADVADKLLMLLGKMPGQVTVTGHADLVGGEDVNQRIGLRRAEAVRAALIEHGVPEGSVAAVSEGEGSPVVKKAGPEPRNRRVEVRFRGQVIVPGADFGTFGKAGILRPPGPPPTGFDPFKPLPPYGQFSQPPAGKPPYVQPGPTGVTSQPGPKGSEGPAHAGSAGDLGKAVLAIPQVKAQVDVAKEKLGRDVGKVWKGATLPEKVALGSVAVSTASLVAVGVLSDPAATSTARDLLDGAEVPIPGVKGLKFKLHTKGQLGGSVVIDVLEIGR